MSLSGPRHKAATAEAVAATAPQQSPNRVVSSFVARVCHICSSTVTVAAAAAAVATVPSDEKTASFSLSASGQQRPSSCVSNRSDAAPCMRTPGALSLSELSTAHTRQSIASVTSVRSLSDSHSATDNALRSSCASHSSTALAHAFAAVAAEALAPTPQPAQSVSADDVSVCAVSEHDAEPAAAAPVAAATAAETENDTGDNSDVVVPAASAAKSVLGSLFTAALHSPPPTVAAATVPAPGPVAVAAPTTTTTPAAAAAVAAVTATRTEGDHVRTSLTKGTGLLRPGFMQQRKK